MLTKGKARCETDPQCDIGLRVNLDYMFWPEKKVGPYLPYPMNQRLVYDRWAGYLQNRETHRGSHTTINACPAHSDEIKHGAEELAMEEILLEEWCEAYHNRRRDNARKALHDSGSRGHSTSDSVDGTGIPEVG